MSSGLNSIRMRSHLVAGWTSGFSRGAIKFSTNARPPSFPKCGFSRGAIKLSTNARPPSFPKCMTSSHNRASSGSRWRKRKRRTKFLSSMLRSRQAACLDQLWRALLNASRKLRSHLRQCDTSSLNASALPLLLVTPDLRRLSRQLNQCQLPRSPELRRIGTMLPFPEAPRTPAQDRLGFGASEILQNNQAERGGTRVSLPLDHPASSLYCVSRCPAYQRVNVGNDYGKTRLYTPIRSKTTALPRCGSENAQVLCVEVMNLLEKGAIEIVPPAQSESGFYSRYFLVPKKEGGLRPILDLRLLNYALMKRSFRMITLKQILTQICPGDWFMSLDLKDTYCHIQVAPPSQTILEIRIRRGGISIQGPAVWAVPGSPHFYTMHGCGSLPSATDGDPHTQLPRWLGHSGSVAGGFNIAQDPPPQPLRLPGAQDQLCQEHTVT